MPHEPRPDYLRTLDLDALANTPTTERFVQSLIGHESGARACTISYIRTPPQGGSPEGMHVHDVDQHFYIVSGTLSFDVDGQQFEGGPGSLVFFPTGVPHRNWNARDDVAVHLAINAPLPEPGKPFARPVDEES